MNKIIASKSTASKSISVSQAYESFIKECEAYNKTESTLRSYRLTRKLLFQAFPEIENDSITTINKEFSVRYTQELASRGIATSSINHYIRDFRVFAYWCIEGCYIMPFKIKLIKERDKLKEPYTNEELRILLRKPLNTAGFMEWRSWAIICIFMSYGLRASTVINIMRNDVDYKQNRITAKYLKNGKIQVFPLNDKLKRSLLEYSRRMPEKSEYLFPSQSGNMLTTSGLNQSIRKYNRRRGVDKISIHLFRHTYGKLWAEHGGGVFELQNIFGHSDIRMTQKYINLYAENNGMPKMSINILKEI